MTLSAENTGTPAVPTPAPDKVVITVGAEKITYAQFEAIVDSLPEQYRAAARGANRKQFAENIARTLVLAQEGRRRKIDQTPAFKTAASFQNENILAGMAAEQVQKELKFDDAAVRKYYDDHKAEYEQVHARHILIRMQGSPVPVRPGEKDLTDAEALAKAQDLRKQIEGGTDFGTLAIKESDDQGSGAKGGDLGMFRRRMMVPAFEEAAFSMKAGELSQPVKSQFGYHLIKVESHEARTFEEVRPEIEKQMKPELAQKMLKDLEAASGGVTYDEGFFGPAAPMAAPAPAPAPAK